MIAAILKRLTYSLLIALAVGLVIGIAAGEAIQGNEAKQGTSMVLILTLLICMMNFLLSLPALFNTRSDVRGNYILSALSFLLLPTISLLGMIFLIFKDENARVEFWDTSMILLPAVVHIAALTFHFVNFQREQQAT